MRRIATSVDARRKPLVQMRTLTVYAIGVAVVLAVLNAIAWQAGTPRLHSINVFSAGFALGVLGTYISAYVNGYRRVAPVRDARGRGLA